MKMPVDLRGKSKKIQDAARLVIRDAIAANEAVRKSRKSADNLAEIIHEAGLPYHELQAALAYSVFDAYEDDCVFTGEGIFIFDSEAQK